MHEGPWHVAVLAGGTSAEREISLLSGAAVREALRERGHQVEIVDPAHSPVESVDWSRFDVAFLALHGTFGEDGGVQRELEHLRVPFTGSSAEVSQLAFSKSAAKERLRQAGIPTPAYVLVHEGDDAARIQKLADAVGWPLVVKPDAQGSSLGVSLVDSPDALATALTRCFHYDAFGLLEACVDGTEWTVPVLDDRTLPPIRIRSASSFYDFHAKYETHDTAYEFDFDDVPPAVAPEVVRVGLDSCRALGTRGLARVDVRLDRFHRPWVLEVNTIPGMTDHSLVPRSAARLGIGFGELCEKAIAAALGAPLEEPADQTRLGRGAR